MCLRIAMVVACLGLALGCGSESSDSPQLQNLAAGGAVWTMAGELNVDALIDESATLCDEPASAVLASGALSAMEFTATAGHSVRTFAGTVGFAPLALGVYGPRGEAGYPTSPLVNAIQSVELAGQVLDVTLLVETDGEYAVVVGLGPASSTFPVVVSLETDGVAGCVGDPCIGMETPCDDGDPCTEDGCVPFTGCAADPLSCDDGDACTADSCDSEGAGCLHEAVDCSDSDACTAEVCDAESGCSTAAISCDDGDHCTVDDCDSGSGCVYEALDCSDNDLCTNQACDPSSGCLVSEVWCDDGNACTEDFCSPTVGCSAALQFCDDADPCTVDTCAPDTGCQFTAATCDDGDPATLDECVPGVGCASTPGLVEGGPACTLSGAAGSYVVCDLELVRAATNTPLPTQLAAELSYDPNRLEIEGLFRAVEVPGQGIQWVSVDQAPLPTGHIGSMEMGAGLLSFSFEHPFAPQSALSLAHIVSGDEVAGFASLISVHAQLVQSATEAFPATLEFGEVTATGAEGALLDASTYEHRIVVSKSAGGVPGPDCAASDLCVQGTLGESAGCDYAAVDCSTGGDSSVCVSGCVEADFESFALPGLPSEAGDFFAVSVPVALENELVPPPNTLRLAVSWNPTEVNLAPLAQPFAAGETAIWIQPSLGVANAQGFALIEVRRFPDASESLDVPHPALVSLLFEPVGEGPESVESLVQIGVGEGALASSATSLDGLEYTVGIDDEQQVVIGLADCGAVEGYCDTGDLCAPGTCDASGSCVMAPVDCDDGVSTTADQCVGGQCKNLVLSGSVFELTGEAGDVVSVPLRIARAAPLLPSPSALQFALGWDASTVTLVDFVAPGGGGNPVGDWPLPSGHTVALSVPVEEAAGSIVVLLADLEGQPATLSEAHLLDGEIAGEAEFLIARFELLAAVTEGAPATVEISEILGAAVDATPLPGSLIGDVMVVAPESFVPSANCHSPGWGCTDEGCKSATCEAEGVCSYSDGQCDDGDPDTFGVCEATGCAYYSGEGLAGIAWGAAGSQVVVPIQVARASEATPAPAAATFELSWPSAALALVGFQAQLSVPGLEDPIGLAVPPAALSTGHVLATSPAIEGASGSIVVDLQHLSAPETALTDAFAAGEGAIVGDVGVVEAVFELAADVSPGAPALVELESVEATSGDGTALFGTLSGGVVVYDTGSCISGTQPCLVPECGEATCLPDGSCEYPAILSCDDGDPETAESCSETESLCVSEMDEVACLVPPGAVDYLCPLRLARASESVPPAVGVQFKLDYDPDEIEPVDFVAWWQPPFLDAPILIDASENLPSGHSVNIIDFNADPESWWDPVNPPPLGVIEMLIIGIGSIDPLTGAYLNDDGTVVGEDVFITARITRKPGSNAFAEPLTYSAVEATDSAASELSVTFAHGRLVVDKKD